MCNEKRVQYDAFSFLMQDTRSMKKIEGLIAIDDIQTRAQFLDWERFVWKWED